MLASSFYKGSIAAIREQAPKIPVGVLVWHSLADGLDIVRRYDTEVIYPSWNFVQRMSFAGGQYHLDREPEVGVDVVDAAHGDSLTVNVWTVDTWYRADRFDALTSSSHRRLSLHCVGTKTEVSGIDRYAYVDRPPTADQTDDPNKIKMDLTERIARRRGNSRTEDLVMDWDKLDPSIHLDEPVGRGAILEQILDTMEPFFRSELPSNLVVWGPQGSGKSAIVVSLLSSLTDEFTEARSRLYTATRGGKIHDHIRFAYADARRASSEHKLYYSILEHLTSESVPERGIGTEELRDQVKTELAGSPGAVIAIDHADETEAIDQASMTDLATEFDDASWIITGRSNPQLFPPGEMATQIKVPAYRTHELIDLLTVRANRGLNAGISHAQAQTIADWADGNAHDALVVLFTATLVARETGHAQIHDADIDVAIDQTVKDIGSIGRVLALNENRQTVVATLLELSDTQRETIETTADAIATNSDLTKTTVRRFLYELADDGFFTKVQADAISTNGGRRATRLEPRFPIAVFKQLYSPEP